MDKGDTNLLQEKVVSSDIFKKTESYFQEDKSIFPRIMHCFGTDACLHEFCLNFADCMVQSELLSLCMGTHISY